MGFASWGALTNTVCMTVCPSWAGIKECFHCPLSGRLNSSSIPAPFGWHMAWEVFPRRSVNSTFSPSSRQGRCTSGFTTCSTPGRAVNVNQSAGSVSMRNLDRASGRRKKLRWPIDSSIASEICCRSVSVPAKVYRPDNWGTPATGEACATSDRPSPRNARSRNRVRKHSREEQRVIAEKCNELARFGKGKISSGGATGISGG